MACAPRLAMAESAQNDAVAAKSDVENAARSGAGRGAENPKRRLKEAEQAKAEVEKQHWSLARGGGKSRSTRFGDVKDFANEIIFDVYEKVVDIPGSSDAANLMLNTSLSFLKKLQADSGDDPTVARRMMVAYNRLGVMASSDRATPRTLPRAITWRWRSRFPGQTGRQGHRGTRDLAICYSDHLGDILVKNGDPKTRPRAIPGGLLPSGTHWRQPCPAMRLRLGPGELSYDLLGGVLHELRDDKGALEKFKKGLEICEALVKLDPENDAFQRNLAVSCEHVGRALWRSDDDKGALEQYKKSFAINEKLARAEPASVVAQRNLAISYDNIGDVLADQRDTKGAAREQYQKSYDIWDRLARADRANAQLQRDLAISLDHMGDMMASAATDNVTGAARSNIRSRWDIRERQARLDPSQRQGAALNAAVEYSTMGNSLSG